MQTDKFRSFFLKTKTHGTLPPFGTNTSMGGCKWKHLECKKDEAVLSELINLFPNTKQVHLWQREEKEFKVYIRQQ